MRKLTYLLSMNSPRAEITSEAGTGSEFCLSLTVGCKL